MSRYLRPMLSQHAPTERVDLHLTHNGHPGTFQAEFETADAGEQGQDVHGPTTGSGTGPWQAHRHRKVSTPGG